MSRSRPTIRPSSVERLQASSWQARGLTYWWTADRPETNLIAPTPTPAITGTLPTTHVGILNAAKDFSGSTNYVSAPGHQLGAWTHAVWLKVVTDTDQVLLQIAEAPNNSTFDRNVGIQGTSAPYAYIFDGSAKQADSPVAVAAGDIVHIVGWTDGTALKIYVNGKEMASTAVDNGGFSGFSTPEFVIGYGQDPGTTTRDSDALISDVRVYNRALLPSEIRALYSPATRWDLYGTKRRRVFAVPAVGGGGGALLEHPGMEGGMDIMVGGLRG